MSFTSQGTSGKYGPKQFQMRLRYCTALVIVVKISFSFRTSRNQFVHINYDPFTKSLVFLKHGEHLPNLWTRIEIKLRKKLEEYFEQRGKIF